MNLMYVIRRINIIDFIYLLPHCTQSTTTLTRNIKDPKRHDRKHYINTTDDYLEQGTILV